MVRRYFYIVGVGAFDDPFDALAIFYPRTIKKQRLRAVVGASPYHLKCYSIPYILSVFFAASSVGYAATCLASARSRSGSDNTPCCHSRPSRRCATSTPRKQRLSVSVTVEKDTNASNGASGTSPPTIIKYRPSSPPTNQNLNTRAKKDSLLQGSPDVYLIIWSDTSDINRYNQRDWSFQRCYQSSW